MSSDREHEPFLNRWARQKRAEARDQVPVEPQVPEAPSADLSKLPNVDELNADSDITGFLQKGVPEALQKLALRRIWTLDPNIRDFVEMAENQWDFNAPGGIHGLYQDVVEGTDMSTWLAQATHSVAAAPVQQQAPVESVAGANNAAPQQAVLEKSGSVSPPNETSAAGTGVDPNSDRAYQPAEIAKSSSAAAENPPSEPQKLRLRHGGALPA